MRETVCGQIKNRITVEAWSLRLYKHTVTMVAVQSSAVPITAGPMFISGTFDTRVSTLQSCPQYSHPFPTYYSVQAISHRIKAQCTLKLQNLT